MQTRNKQNAPRHTGKGKRSQETWIKYLTKLMSQPPYIYYQWKFRIHNYLSE